MKIMTLGTAVFVVTILFYKPSCCNVLPLNAIDENLRIRPEPEQLLQQRFGRQSGQVVVTVGLDIDDHQPSTNGDAEITADSLNRNGKFNVKEDLRLKRCSPRYEPANSILGSTNGGHPNLNVVRRDIPSDIVRRRCENCRNSPKCKNLGNCELCDRICKPFQDINTIDVLNVPEDAQDRTVGMSESMKDLKRDDPTIVALSNRQLDIPLNEPSPVIDAGLSEMDDRFYTIGSFGPGPVQSLLARLLKINEKTKLESLIVLAKTSALKKARTLENPVIIDTAHVFTLNDGTSSPLAMELHPVNADKDVVELTRTLNHDLDKALEQKKQQRANAHLSAREIDEIIGQALNTGSTKLLDGERVGDPNLSDPSNPNHSEDVGCKKKDKDDSDKYYSIQPINYGGIYREADSSEEQGISTDRTIVEEIPKSISSRNGGLKDDGDELDRLRTTKKENGDRKHHLMDSDDQPDGILRAVHGDKVEDQPQSDEILHVEQDRNQTPIKSDSHSFKANKLVEHNTQDVEKSTSNEDDSNESTENDQERHKDKKTKKKHKKHKKGEHNGGYYGGYRNTQEDPQVGEALQANDDEEVTSRARSNYETPQQPIHHPDPYQPDQQPEQQNHHEESHQYDVPALPNSYQPEEGYGIQDNYQSEETYYVSDSSEEGYNAEKENYGEGDGYQEPQQKKAEYNQQEQHATPQYNQGYVQPQAPQKQQQSTVPYQQYQEGGQQPTYQQAPQKAEQEVSKPPEEQQQPYPQAHNPVYNHPAPPLEQGTYIPKKPQYNEEPKMLPSFQEGEKQYPISRHEMMVPYQGGNQEKPEYDGYGNEEGHNEPVQQEIVIPGLKLADEDYIVGKAETKIVEPPKTSSQLAAQYSKILQEDLSQGVKLANKTAEAINRRINQIIEGSKNLSDKERLAQIDAIESAIDDMDDKRIKDPLVGDNLKQFQARFNKNGMEGTTVTDPAIGGALQNEQGTLLVQKTPILYTKHLAKQIEEPIISMANIPSDSKSAPFVDPKAMVHQLAVDQMMSGKTPERVGCKHKDDSSEEYQYGEYYRTANEEKPVKDKPQREQDDEVGCKKNKKDKDSEEELIYVQPPSYNANAGYGHYRENEQDTDRRPPHEVIDQPTNIVTSEAIEDRILGLEEPPKEESGPSGPFTDEPVDATVDDGIVGCKKKDKESHEELIYVYPPKPQYNEYGGYRENEDGGERKKPMEKVKEFVESIVHPSKAAKGKSSDQSVVQKVNQREGSTEIPISILPALIEGMKQLRNRHNLERNQAETKPTIPSTSTEISREKIVVPPSNIAAFVPPVSPEFNPQDLRHNIINNPPQQFNAPNIQHFMRPPPNPTSNSNSHNPIQENLAMLEAFHRQQNPQEFVPTINERVGAVQPQNLLENQQQVISQNHHLVNEDMTFGKMIPAKPIDMIDGVESREVNEKTQMFFVGDGIKLPIHVKKQQDGTMHLSIDVGKLCKCNNVTCTHAVEGLANLVPTLEKLNHGKVELEVNEDSFNSALNNLNQGHNTMHGNTEKSKRSPTAPSDTKPPLEENHRRELNELSTSSSGELVPVFDDERLDDISPIKKYYSGDLAKDLVNLKDNIQMYYQNEDKFKEYMSEHQRNKGFLDEFITKRVELLTNVLSWMKSIAMDEVRQQQHIDG